MFTSATSIAVRKYLAWHLIPLAVWGGVWLASSEQLATHAASNAWMGAYWEGRSLLAAPLLSLGSFLPGLLPDAHRAVALLDPGGLSIWWSGLGGLAAAMCLLAAVGGALRGPAERRREPPAL